MNSTTRITLTLASIVVVGAARPPQAVSYPQFQKQFLTKYIDGHDNKEFVGLVKTKVKCFVCHDAKKDAEGKTSKKNRNAYGQELSKLLNKNDKKNVKKIQEALDKVATVNSDPKNPASPSYGELIAQGKLPAGAPDELPSDEPEDEPDQ